MPAPRWQRDHELLACVASQLHALRITGYPELVDAGRMTAIAAADRTDRTRLFIGLSIGKGAPAARLGGRGRGDGRSRG